MAGRKAFSGVSTRVAGLGAGVALIALGAAPGFPPAPAEPDGATIRGIVTLAEGATATAPAPGTVTYTGTPPAGEAIDMSADPYCREQHSSAVVDRPVRVGPGGGLADVLVHVTNAPSGADTPADAVLLDQIGCIYTPSVVAARVDQTVTIRNSDATLHNVRVTPRINRGFNLGQPIRGIESKRSFAQPELEIAVRCDIHGWMHATIHVLDHGFFALSSEDGRFELPELPPGEYAIEARHPTLGTSSRTVTVAAGASPEIRFEFGS